MTTEEKGLLLKDLCERLPYGVIMGNKTLLNTHYMLRGAYIDEAEFDDEFDDIPYLRPMSSITEEEKKELLNTILGEDGSQYFSVDVDGNIENTDSEYQDLNNFNLHYVSFNCETVSTYIDWLNAHHFDYRGLIEKGLALEAPNGMYKKGGSK